MGWIPYHKTEVKICKWKCLSWEPALLFCKPGLCLVEPDFTRQCQFAASVCHKLLKFVKDFLHVSRKIFYFFFAILKCSFIINLSFMLPALQSFWPSYTIFTAIHLREMKTYKCTKPFQTTIYSLLLKSVSLKIFHWVNKLTEIFPLIKV